MHFFELKTKSFVKQYRRLLWSWYLYGVKKMYFALKHQWILNEKKGENFTQEAQSPFFVHLTNRKVVLRRNTRAVSQQKSILARDLHSDSFIYKLFESGGGSFFSFLNWFLSNVYISLTLLFYSILQHFLVIHFGATETSIAKVC